MDKPVLLRSGDEVSGVLEPVTASYDYRLRQFQKTYCSTLDWKNAVFTMHDAIIRFARQASIEEDKLKRFAWETKAQHILNYLTANIRDSKTKVGADSETCDYLIMIYLSSSIHLSIGQYQEAINLMSNLSRP
jgi:hypothetical protein